MDLLKNNRGARVLHLSKWATLVVLAFVLPHWTSPCVAQQAANANDVREAPGAFIKQEVAPQRAALDASEPLSINEKMQATLWVQTALEHRVLCAQAYKLAEAKLRAGMQNPAWTAATEQGLDFARKPPAVVLDVDETVLDNSPFNARLAATNQEYNAEDWGRWCDEASAKCLPGAREFIHYALRSGVDVFYVTNRDQKLKQVTATNLAQVLGKSIASDRLLLKNERPAWTSDKTTRRAHIATTHRILLLIGDDFNDFVNLRQPQVEQRIQAGEHFAASWGHHWIMLPNPLYGHWEMAMYGYRYDRSEQEKLRIRHSLLRK